MKDGPRRFPAVWKIERWRKALNAIPELKRLPRGFAAFRKWRRNAEVAVANAFGK